MKCAGCLKSVGGGEQGRRRAEHWRQGDGSVKVFGIGMPDGPLAAATGQLVKVEHNGCYWARVKKEQRAAR